MVNYGEAETNDLFLPISKTAVFDTKKTSKTGKNYRKNSTGKKINGFFHIHQKQSEEAHSVSNHVRRQKL